MIKSLSIKNFALAKDVTVEFGTGLNVVTGETGSGKSLLFRALGLLAGQRIDSSFLSSSSMDAEVTAHIMSSQGSFLFHKKISSNGKSRCFLNQTLTPPAKFYSLFSSLVQAGEQFEAQGLFKKEKHTFYLDEFGGLTELFKEYEKSYMALGEVKKNLENLREEKTLLSRQKELLEFEYASLKEVNLSQEEFDQLLSKRLVFKNSHQIISLAQDIQSFVEENSLPFLLQAKKRSLKLEELLGIESDVFKHFDLAEESFNVILDWAQDALSSCSINEEECGRLEERISFYHKILKRFGPTIEKVIEEKSIRSKQLKRLEEIDDIILSQEELWKELSYVAISKAQKLSRERKKASADLCQAVKTELLEFGLQDAQFVCVFEPNEQSGAQSLSHSNLAIKAFSLELGSHVSFTGLKESDGGQDLVNTAKNSEYLNQLASQLSPLGLEVAQFYFLPHTGQTLFPLQKIASGGELSRILLALKLALFSRRPAMTFVFDEIDVGVSGSISSKMGKRMLKFCRIYKEAQIILITHSPQIVVFADHYFIVEKKLEEMGSKAVSVKKANEEEQLRSISYLLSGEEILDSAHIQAQRLREQAFQQVLDL